MSEREPNSASGRKCPRCGADLPANVPPELCPKCLLQAALPTQAGQPKTEPAAAPAPTRSRGLPQPGQQLGHYRIVRLLGEGGMGAVFDAEDLENGRRVALKVLSQTLDSPEARERFLREGRTAASINHPNSVYVFGTEEIGGTPVIAMELVNGGTLQDRVRNHGPLPVAEAVDCVLQIIAGLEAAQRIGILHRDIKPSNCFRDADGTVKIGDFGLSISTTIRTEPALTATASFLGTPAFCSPEQLRGDQLNVRSDMYSVGATLFYLLTGRTPFEANNTVQLLATVLDQRAPSPAKFRPAVPQALARVVLRCLEKQPGERFKSYRELAQALAPYNSASPTPATLGLRFVAGVLDATLLSITWTILLFLAGVSPVDFLNLAGKASPKALTILLPSLLGSLLYYALFEGLWGAAFGKFICRLRIVGPDRNVPGFRRAFARALIFQVVPMLPFWLTYGPNPQAYVHASVATQFLMGCSVYIVLALLFSTARRRNGFAAVHDLITNTRVISRAALESRPVPQTGEPPPLPAGGGRLIGPYHVLDSLEKSSRAEWLSTGGEWLLGYDLRLLRKVWIRIVPPGTPPVLPMLRNLGRVGRLRWLTGPRSPEENWDAYEALSGNPLLSLAQDPQPWRQVRYWLYDLAREMSAAARDGTFPPVLSLACVWITDDGRAKLLDFPAPGVTASAPPRKDELRESPSPAPPPRRSDPCESPSPARFLSQVAAVALQGQSNAISRTGSALAVPPPLYAREFLDRLPQLPDADAAATALKSLLLRVAEVTRWRRTAIVAGCLAVPLFFGFSMTFGMRMMQSWYQKNQGLMDLNMLLAKRASQNSRWLKNQPHPTDRQFGIYIASHYRSVITNEAVWTGAYTLMMIKGDARKFAEQSLTNYPAPAPEEVKDADAAIGPSLNLNRHLSEMWKKPSAPLLMAGTALTIYVCIPALLAALLFRGGLVLLIAKVTFVRSDGARASRLRVFWRALVAWSPLFLGFALSIPLKIWFGTLVAALVPCLCLCVMAIVSLALPRRSLQDRLAGTWPVPR